MMSHKLANLFKLNVRDSGGILGFGRLSRFSLEKFRRRKWLRETKIFIWKLGKCKIRIFVKKTLQQLQKPYKFIICMVLTSRGTSILTCPLIFLLESSMFRIEMRELHGIFWVPLFYILPCRQFFYISISINFSYSILYYKKSLTISC